jgi:hypothetical protein
MYQNQPNKVLTGEVRLSYAHLAAPYANPTQPGAEPKYSVTLLIPKTDTVTYQDILNSIEAAAQTATNGKTWNGVRPPIILNPLHDGDGVRESDGEPFGAECKGCWVMSVTSKKKPIVIFADKTPITDPNDFYSGCYGKAIINFFVYDTSGNRGISAGLMGVMKQTDGEPLGGGVIQDSDWDDDEDGEENPW